MRDENGLKKRRKGYRTGRGGEGRRGTGRGGETAVGA